MNTIDTLCEYRNKDGKLCNCKECKPIETFTAIRMTLTEYKKNYPESDVPELLYFYLYCKDLPEELVNLLSKYIYLCHIQSTKYMFSSIIMCSKLLWKDYYAEYVKYKNNDLSVLEC